MIASRIQALAQRRQELWAQRARNPDDVQLQRKILELTEALNGHALEISRQGKSVYFTDDLVAAPAGLFGGIRLHEPRCERLPAAPLPDELRDVDRLMRDHRGCDEPTDAPKDRLRRAFPFGNTPVKDAKHGRGYLVSQKMQSGGDHDLAPLLYALITDRLPFASTLAEHRAALTRRGPVAGETLRARREAEFVVRILDALGVSNERIGRLFRCNARTVVRITGNTMEVSKAMSIEHRLANQDHHMVKQYESLQRIEGALVALMRWALALPESPKPDEVAAFLDYEAAE